MHKHKYILVIGSKPDSRLPNLDVLRIYSANGAAEKANQYQKFFGKKKFTAVAGTMEFFKNRNVRDRVLKSEPNLIYFRSGLVKNYHMEQFSKDVKFKSKSNFQQLLFQSKFLRYGVLPIVFGEFFKEKKIFSKLKHLFKIIFIKGMLGANTGLFSIMLAKFENPDCKIIISGIGIIKTGDTFYGTKGTTNRSIVDKWIFSALDEKIKKDLITTDKETATSCNIQLFKNLI
tara:strand:- start:477 stop:1169 length:693 start_codon:yes stop_codon:yes gene_type:complete